MTTPPDPREPLTPRQQQVLDTICTFIKAHGYPPSFRQLGALLGIRSPNGVKCNLQALIKKGYLRKADTVARSLVPVDYPGPGANAGAGARVRVEVSDAGILLDVGNGSVTLEVDAAEQLAERLREAAGQWRQRPVPEPELVPVLVPKEPEPAAEEVEEEGRRKLMALIRGEVSQ